MAHSAIIVDVVGDRIDFGELAAAGIHPIAIAATGVAGIAFHRGDVAAIEAGDDAHMANAAKLGEVDGEHVSGHRHAGRLTGRPYSCGNP
jgi:hypothetical protein